MLIFQILRLLRNPKLGLELLAQLGLCLPVATVQIHRITGTLAASTATNVTSGSIHAGTQDANTSPSRIPVPSSGSNYSYWFTLGLNCTASADNSLNNVKFYTDGGNSLGTGVTALIAVASSYTSAIGTAGSSGVILSSASYVSLSGTAPATSSLFLYTSGCQLTLTGSLAGAVTGSFANRVAIQLSVDTTASAGNSGAETLTFTWDEA